MNLNTTGIPALDTLGIPLLIGGLALPGATGAVIWYGIKVWFTAKNRKSNMAGEIGDLRRGLFSREIRT